MERLAGSTDLRKKNRVIHIPRHPGASAGWHAHGSGPPRFTEWLADDFTPGELIARAG